MASRFTWQGERYPRAALDHILLSEGLLPLIQSVEVEGHGASDHRALVVELRLPGAAEPGPEQAEHPVGGGGGGGGLSWKEFQSAHKGEGSKADWARGGSLNEAYHRQKGGGKAKGQAKRHAKEKAKGKGKGKKRWY